MTKLREFYKKYKLWLALALFASLAAGCAKWIDYDAVRPAIARGHNSHYRAEYQILCDDYGELSAPLSQSAVRQTVTVSPGTTVYGFRFKHAADGPLDGTLGVMLYSESGELAAEAYLDSSLLSEDHFIEADLSSPIETVKYTARYILEISYDKGEGADIALWRSGSQQIGFRCEQGGEECGTLVLQLADGVVSPGLRGALWALALFVIIGLCAAFWLLFMRRVKLHIAFAVCAAVLGIAFAFVTPTLGAPDEDVHYITAYEYSSELLGAQRREGGKIVMRYCDVPRLNDAGRVKREYNAFAYSRLYESLTSKEAPDSELVAISTASAYGVSRLIYIPQIIGISLARACGMGGAAVQLMGRLFNLAVYIALTAFAVKKAPFAKAVFAVAALFPMSLEIAASLCYDALVIGMSFAFVALCLRCAYGEEKPKVYELAALGILALLIAPSKAIYLPLIGLLLIVAPKLFKDVKKGFLAIAAVIIVAGIAWFATNGSTLITQISGERSAALALTDEQIAETFPNGDATHYFSFGYILARPDEAAELGLRTLQYDTPLYLQGLVGGRLGEQILVNIEINWLLIIALIFTALLATVKPRGERLDFKGWPRALSAFIALCVAALAVLVCMTWTPINYETIYGIQGRYLLPALPLALLALRNSTITLSRNIDRRLIFAACALVYLVELDALSKILAR